MKKELKLGTRKSLLALAQSQWVAHQIERHHPEITVNLVGIETRGDRILDVPLTAVTGKEFFVAELDEALRAGRVDLTVHSMKDLSLDRPAAFVCAAIPPRENPRDVLLFHGNVIERIKKGKPLRIGTSSPRRIENIPSFLKQVLPQVAPFNNGEPALEFLEIRGNVNTRLSRVHEAEDSSKFLDGVVLAFAGLIRLWADPKGQQELRRLLTGVRWMVLPLRECPAAAAQGALAIECRADDLETREALKDIHDQATSQQVARERQLLADWGGGCHQRFGATALATKELGELFFVRGRKPDSTFVEDLQWEVPRAMREREFCSTPVPFWDGSQWSAQTASPVDHVQPEGLSSAALFVAHSRAVEGVGISSSPSRLWVSGVKSWKKLAKRGLWVEGCMEGLGFDEGKATVQESVLQLPPLKEWQVLTHTEAQAEWVAQGMAPLSTYKVNLEYGSEAKAALKAAQYVFWSSGSQWNALKEEVSLQAIHACGPGKTASRLRASGLRPLIFPSVEEWKKWIHQNIP